MRVRALLAAGLAAGLASEPPVFAMPAGVAPPSLALTCRVYARAVGVLIASLLDSHAIFWPGESLWPASSVALVWDAESEDDRKAAAALSLRFPRVRHLWEAAPPDGTLCGVACFFARVAPKSRLDGVATGALSGAAGGTFAGCTLSGSSSSSSSSSGCGFGGSSSSSSGSRGTLPPQPMLLCWSR